MLDLFLEPLNIISLIILLLIVVVVFNPWGLRDKLFEYVNIDIDINVGKILRDLLEWLKSKISNEATLELSPSGINTNVAISPPSDLEGSFGIMKSVFLYLCGEMRFSNITGVNCQ